MGLDDGPPTLGYSFPHEASVQKPWAQPRTHRDGTLAPDAHPETKVVIPVFNAVV
jgi:hypothetical protein